MASPNTPLSVIDAYDDDLTMVGALQLNALDRMQNESRKYVWRVVERVSFLPMGGQQWNRHLQLRLPSLPPVSAHKSLLVHTDFIVSLGTFRRRRFADFTVTTADGKRCNLLTRRQHGYCLATCLLLQFLHADEWERLNRPVLQRLHSYLASLTTTVPQTDTYTTAGALALLDELFVSSGINDDDRKESAQAILSNHCRSMAMQTQYLCWVRAAPGETISLHACYTQADSPRPLYEPESEQDGLTDFRPRLWWRNWRTKQYAKYNMFPLRYSFDSPTYEDCQSYYFTIAPPPDTRITLLDWGSGHRSRTAVEDAGWTKSEPYRNPRLTAPDGTAEELDCASFGYHFHNRRTTGRRRHERRRISTDCGSPHLERRIADRRQSKSERRKASETRGNRLHAFVRSDPIDNGKLAAIGCLGLALAILAERGTLIGGTGTSQWLLLAPAALVLFVSQQQRHYYARFTRRYRLSVWVYITLAMLFAASVSFDVPTMPLVSQAMNSMMPRIVSAVFAFASGILVLASLWGGRYFERRTRKRYRRVVERVHTFGTPSLWDTLKCRRRKYPMQPTSSDPQGKHPSDKVYTSIARHDFDRVLILTGIVVVAVGGAMLFHLASWHWGFGEKCAIAREHFEAKNGTLAVPGKCEDGDWIVSHVITAESLNPQ